MLLSFFNPSYVLVRTYVRRRRKKRRRMRCTRRGAGWETTAEVEERASVRRVGERNRLAQRFASKAQNITRDAPTFLGIPRTPSSVASPSSLSLSPSVLFSSSLDLFLITIVSSLSGHGGCVSLFLFSLYARLLSLSLFASIFIYPCFDPRCR